MTDENEFEGTEIAKTELRVAGSISGRVHAPHLRIGDEVLVIGPAVVSKVQHNNSDEGLVRVQIAKASDLFVVEDQMDAADLLHKLRSERKAQLDALLGTTPLFGEDGDGDDGAGS